MASKVFLRYAIPPPSVPLWDREFVMGTEYPPLIKIENDSSYPLASILLAVAFLK